MTLQREADELETRANQLRQQAEEAHATNMPNNIKAWIDYEFESSSGLTPEFAAFSRQIKTELRKLMIGYTLLNYNRGHFDFSAFFQNNKTTKIIYISSSDIRHYPNDWYNLLLIRTAKHDKDHTVSYNHYTSLPTIKIKADKLTA